MQHDFDIATVDANTGLTFRAAVNAALQALAGLSSGATAPATTYAYQLWADTASGLLKIRNGANNAWITVGTLASTNLGLLSLATSQTITAQHTINPAATGAPFVLGANALTQLVSGLNADYLDGYHYSDLLKNKNFIINGDCRVGQRGAARTLVGGVTTYGYVDRFAGYATGTEISAGTLTQDVFPDTAEKCVRFSGMTITGAGVLFLRYRVEALDAALLAGKYLSFGCKIYHDFGAAKNFTIYLRKPAAAANDFSSLTEITNSGAISVATATATTIKIENANIGDCSLGLEILIQVDCGTVTTKNLYATQFQLNIGSKILDFEIVPYAEQLAKCMRYTQVIIASGDLYIGTMISSDSTHACGIFPLSAPMIKTPTLTAGNGFVARFDGTKYALSSLTLWGVTNHTYTLSAVFAPIGESTKSDQFLGLYDGGYLILDAEI